MRMGLQAKAAGIQNILALRGDPPKGEENFTAVDGGFSCALDLVKYIRSGSSGFLYFHSDTVFSAIHVTSTRMLARLTEIREQT